MIFSPQKQKTKKKGKIILTLYKWGNYAHF